MEDVVTSEEIDVDAPAVDGSEVKQAEIAAAIDAASKRQAAAAAEDEPVDDTPVVDTPVVEVPVDTTPYDLALPSMLTDDEADEHAPTLDSFAIAAHASGIDQPVAQQLAAVYASVSRALVPVMSRVNTVTGETEYSDLSDLDEMKAVALQALGADAPAIHAAASTYVRAHPALAQWLDDSYVGNSPAALVALALASEGVFALSPLNAKAELSKLTGDLKSAFYHAGPGHVVAVAKVNILTGIIAEGEQFDSEVDTLIASERAAADAAKAKAEADALAAKDAAEVDRKRNEFRAEQGRRDAKAAELKASALVRARADAASAAEARKAKAWQSTQAPSAATVSAAEVSAAKSEAAELIRSGKLDGSSPAAQTAKARFQTLLQAISAAA